MAAALTLVTAWLTAAVFTGPVAAMMVPNLSRRNFRGEVIPTAMGIVLLLAVLTALTVAAITGWIEAGQFRLSAFWLSLVCLAGLVDDAAGSHKDRGFRGHFSALLEGRLTSGMVKVLIIGGGALALTAVPLHRESLPRLGVLLLAVNLFNQLDLRPGRSLKAFLAAAGIFALGGNIAAAAGCGGALELLSGDLQGRYMLGDAGANLLGALAGLLLINALSGLWLYLALSLLVLGNLAGEFLSFSRLIEGNKTLNWLDKLGR